MFKIGDLITCTRRGKYTYTTKGVICEVVKIYEGDYNDIRVRIVDTNGIVSTCHEAEYWNIESQYFELANIKKNNINEWR